MAHIERLNERLMVEWTEDQPIIQPVKNHLVKSGVVAELVDILITNSSDAVGRKETLNGLLDRVLVNGPYVCVVQRLPPDSNPNMPTFQVAIRRYKIGAVNPTDAIGDIYVTSFPDWITDADRSLNPS